MKLLIAILFLFFILPQAAYADHLQVAWGSKEYKHLDITCTPPAVNEKIFSTVINRIASFAAIYNDEMLDRHLKKVIVCKDLARNNHWWYRGTYDYETKAIFVEVGDASHEDTNYVLHHEFSSLIFIDYFTKKHKEEWLKNSFFQYSESYDFLETYRETWIPNPEHQSKGAFWRYSMTSMENDFNLIAGFRYGIGLNPQLRIAASKYPAIANKQHIVEEIYKPFLK